MRSSQGEGHSTVLLIALALVSLQANAADRLVVKSEQQACEVLVRAATDLCLPRRDLQGRYYCDALPDKPEYYVLGLRYRVTPDELVGSNLIGWFGIRKSDGVVVDWDITEETPLPLPSRCPFEAE